MLRFLLHPEDGDPSAMSLFCVSLFSVASRLRINRTLVDLQHALRFLTENREFFHKTLSLRKHPPISADARSTIDNARTQGRKMGAGKA